MNGGEIFARIDSEYREKYGRLSKTISDGRHGVSVEIAGYKWDIIVRSGLDFRTSSPCLRTQRLCLAFAGQEPFSPAAKKRFIIDYLGIFCSYEREIELHLYDIGNAFGIGLSDLSLAKTGYLNECYSKMPGAPGRPLKIAFVCGQYRKNMFNTVYAFLRRLSPSVQAYLPESALAGQSREAVGADLISLNALLETKYDCVVSFGGVECFDRNKLRADNIFFLLTNFDHNYLKSKARKHLRNYGDGVSFGYNLFQDALGREGFAALSDKIAFLGGINWAADIQLDYDASAIKPVFDYIFLGGRDRDFKMLFENRALFRGKKIVVTKCEAADAVQRRYISRLRTDPNFLCMDGVDYYPQLLLYSRVALAFFRGRHETDYTSLCDASWYGKPVIANRVKANRHLENILLFVEGDDRPLADALNVLNDRREYEERSKIARAYAREKQNLHSVLLDMARRMMPAPRSTDG